MNYGGVGDYVVVASCKIGDVERKKAQELMTARGSDDNVVLKEDGTIMVFLDNNLNKATVQDEVLYSRKVQPSKDAAEIALQKLRESTKRLRPS